MQFELDKKHEDIILIKNAGTDTAIVKLTRYEIEVVPGTGEYFCWGANCQNIVMAGVTPVWSVADTVIIQAGASKKGGFQVYFSPQKNAGSAKYQYEFRDERNSSNVTSVYVRWSISYITGLSEEVRSLDFGLFPNPAEEATQLKFNKNMNFNSQVVEVYNITGKKMSSVTIAKGVETLDINTEKLNSGVYFVNVLIDGTMVSTKKLVLKK